MAEDCQHAGLTAGTHCGDCSAVLVARTETPKAEHTPGQCQYCAATLSGAWNADETVWTDTTTIPLAENKTIWYTADGMFDGQTINLMLAPEYSMDSVEISYTVHYGRTQSVTVTAEDCGTMDTK